MRRLELQAGAPRWQGGRDVKRKTAAKQTLEQALALLKPLDAAIWVSRARDELGRIGLRRATVSEGLTPAQTRVAELAATGLSNQEIAIALYMSTPPSSHTSPRSTASTACAPALSLSVRWP